MTLSWIFGHKVYQGKEIANQVTRKGQAESLWNRNYFMELQEQKPEHLSMDGWKKGQDKDRQNNSLKFSKVYVRPSKSEPECK